MGESSDPIASLRDIWIMSRAAVVTRSITQTKQAGTLAAPWGIRSHSLSPFWVQKAVNSAKRSNIEKTKAATRVTRTSSERGIVIG